MGARSMPLWPCCCSCLLATTSACSAATLQCCKPVVHLAPCLRHPHVREEVGQLCPLVLAGCGWPASQWNISCLVRSNQTQPGWTPWTKYALTNTSVNPDYLISLIITRDLKLEAGNHSAPENLFCPPLIMHPIVVSRAFFDQNRRGGVPLRCFIRIKEQIPYKASRNKKGDKENEKNYT